MPPNSNPQLSNIDFTKVKSLFKRELERHKKRTPKSQAMLQQAKKVMPNGVPMPWMSGFYETPPMFIDRGDGGSFFDIDGNRYLDMNQADLAASCGFTPQPVIEAVQEQFARGSSFLLPTESAVEVATLLAERYGLPMWQFTLSASNANTEAIRLARATTGREEVLMFYGRYHGHWDDILVESSPDRARVDFLGIPGQAGSRSSNIHFNNLEALETALKTRRYACLIAEPAMTNCILVQPDTDFWRQAYALCRQYDSLLILDETHTQTFAYGGLKTLWDLECDILSLGKCLGGGIAIGAWGTRQDLARFSVDKIDRYRGGNVLPLGGTLFANALSMAAAKSVLEDMLTPRAYEKVDQLGRQLSAGLNQIFNNHKLPWHAPHLGGRSGYYLTPVSPRNSEEAAVSINYELIDARRCFLTTHGVWDAIASAGPSASFAHESEDIDAYLNAVELFIAEILR